jgi:hypothetical protein
VNPEVNAAYALHLEQQSDQAAAAARGDSSERRPRTARRCYFLGIIEYDLRKSTIGRSISFRRRRRSIRRIPNVRVRLALAYSRMGQMPQRGAMHLQEMVGRPQRAPGSSQPEGTPPAANPTPSRQGRGHDSGVTPVALALIYA